MRDKLTVAKPNKFDLAASILIAALIPFAVFYNVELFYLINGIYLSPLNNIFLFYTQAGDGLTAILIFLWLWFKSPRLSIAGLISLIVLTIFVQSMKSIFHLPRPLNALEEVNILGEALKYRSFPSGHSATFIATAAILWRAYRNNIGWLFLALALIGGVSRIYIGVHFPLDVAVGFAVGLISVWIAVKIAAITGCGKISEGNPRPKRVIAPLILILGIYSLLSHGIGMDVNFFKILGAFFILVGVISALKVFKFKLGV